MFKKIAILAFALFATMTVLASNTAWSQMRPQPFTGVYGGIAGGIYGGTSDAQFSNNLFAPFTTGLMFPHHMTSQSGVGGLGSLFAGYGYTFSNHFYLGGELDGNLYGQPSDDTTSLSTISVIGLPFAMAVTNRYSAKQSAKPEYGFAGSILPGYVFGNSWLLYGRLGLGTLQSKVDTSTGMVSTLSGTFGGTLGRSYFTTHDKSDINNTTYILGIGTEYRMTRHVALRGEVDYQGSDSKSFCSGSFAGICLSNTKIQPSYGEALVGITYTI